MKKKYLLPLGLCSVLLMAATEGGCPNSNQGKMMEQKNNSLDYRFSVAKPSSASDLTLYLIIDSKTGTEILFITQTAGASASGAVILPKPPIKLEQ